MQYAWPPLNFNVPLRGVTSVTSWDSRGLSRQGLMSHEGPSRGLGSPVCVPRAVLRPGQGTAWRWCPIPSSEAGAGGRHVRRPPPSSPVPGRPAVSALGFACAALVSLSAFENASPRPAPRLSESRVGGELACGPFWATGWAWRRGSKGLREQADRAGVGIFQTAPRVRLHPPAGAGAGVSCEEPGQPPALPLPLRAPTYLGACVLCRVGAQSGPQRLS